ncbi:hypothetical protein [Citrobacter amalonaticus]|uniref:hypothetical protein n=1 Tax=Citrobacter amalonaticus TaxID=35703 RepID=UPI001908A93A|nr:hypothetical protein [Citrobacter amalonaticus]MBJ9863590.1 hypothetical protein [Citrobacter amalonaticus]
MKIYNPELVSLWIVILIFFFAGITNLLGLKFIKPPLLPLSVSWWRSKAVGVLEIIIALLLFQRFFVIPVLIIASLLMGSATLVNMFHGRTFRASAPMSAMIFSIIALSFYL